MATIHRLKSFNQSTVLKKYMDSNRMPVSLYYSVLRNLRSVVRRDIPFKCEASFTKDIECIARKSTQDLVCSLQRHWEQLTQLQKQSMQNKWESLDEDQKSVKKTLESDFKKDRARKLSKVSRLGIPTKATWNIKEAPNSCATGAGIEKSGYGIDKAQSSLLREQNTQSLESEYKYNTEQNISRWC